MKRIELLHRLVPHRLAHRHKKHLNILKAASNLVLTGATGKRSGTMHTRCTNSDLVKLGLFRECEVAYAGPYGELRRMVIAAKDDIAWERADNVHDDRSDTDRDDSNQDTHDDRNEDAHDANDGMSISPTSGACPTETTVDSEVIDAADALLCLEQEEGPVFSREVLSPSPLNWNIDY